ncbi:MAG: thioesterase [Anaerolinea sp.]|nr:thioesterase [Anaerolinea sp.]
MQNDLDGRKAPPSHTRWIPDEDAPAGQRAALHRLAAALRGLNNALMDTAAHESELDAAAQTAEALLARLDALPKDRALWGWAESSNSGNTRAHFDSSPVIGLGNAVAPPLRLSIVEDRVEGTANFGTAYEGPPGHVHGGWVAAALDELLGMAQSLTGHGGMTGTLSVRYRRPTPLHRDLTFVGKVDRVEGRKIFTTGTLHDGDTLCAEAEGLFISVDFERMRQMAADR